jgi:hypothetical protein
MIYAKQSPYSNNNIEKYCPTARIPPEGNVFNYIEIQGKTNRLSSFLNYNNYQMQIPIDFQQLSCSFCKDLSKAERQHNSCADCGKHIC